MGRTVAIGVQNFESLIKDNCFYVDKTDFIREWWESKDSVTLIARPRRFGKTLNMSMLERFFSNKYTGDGEIFKGLSVWNNEQYQKLQGTYPVISLSFANVKEKNYQQAKERIYQILTDLYGRNTFLLDSDLLTVNDKIFFNSVNMNMNETTATMSIHQLSKFLSHYYNKKVIVLLDEYDTPMQESYINGYWDELAGFLRSMFNSTFKTNPYMERAIMTGITRISKESIFSDLNNLEVVTTTSNKYETSFGFTEKVYSVDFKTDNYRLILTNYEVEKMFRGMISGWFKKESANYNDFIAALLAGDKKAMNHYMNRVALSTFSSFDTGIRPSGAEPERFYHGFVLGLIVDLNGRYIVNSNRESGLGRYDVLLEPCDRRDVAIIMEFKVHDSEEEKTLEDTVSAALRQIDEKMYDRILLDRGIKSENIKKYGFAFEGKKVLIG